MMMIGKRLISIRIRVAPKMISGMLIDQAEHRAAATSPLAAAATAMTLSRLITRSAMMMVLMAAHSDARRLHAALALLVALQQLDADPQQQQAADQLQVADLQQLIDDQHEDDAQHDGARAAEQDGRLLLLALGERAAGQRDDHGVVAGEHDVDQDDLQETAPKSRCQLEIPYSAVLVLLFLRRHLHCFGRRC